MSASNAAMNNFYSANQVADPGNAGTIVVDRSPGVCNLVSAAAETRTLGRPTRAGCIFTLYHRTDGGDITLTITGGYNEDGETTFVFSDPGQFLMLQSFETSTSGTLEWRKIADYASTNLSLTEAGYLNGITPGTGAASKAAIADSSGGHAFVGRLTTTDGVSSGTAKVIGGLAYSNTAASTAVTGTTTAAQLFDTSYTIPANTLKAGTVVKVRAQGIATAVTSTDAVAYTLYIGGTGGTALISAASTDATANDTFQMDCTLICRTAGTTGTFVATGTYKVSSAEGTMTVKDDITASTTINTTANQVLGVAATWNVANATNSCRLDILTIEIY